MSSKHRTIFIGCWVLSCFLCMSLGIVFGLSWQRAPSSNLSPTVNTLSSPAALKSDDLSMYTLSFAFDHERTTARHLDLEDMMKHVVRFTRGHKQFDVHELLNLNVTDDKEQTVKLDDVSQVNLIQK